MQWTPRHNGQSIKSHSCHRGLDLLINFDFLLILGHYIWQPVSSSYSISTLHSWRNFGTFLARNTPSKATGLSGWSLFVWRQSSICLFKINFNFQFYEKNFFFRNSGAFQRNPRPKKTIPKKNRIVINWTKRKTTWISLLMNSIRCCDSSFGWSKRNLSTTIADWNLKDQEYYWSSEVNPNI